MTRERDEAEAHIDELQIVLDEANDIHETPEVTNKLRDRITAGQTELERQGQEFEELTQSEKQLRETTRSKGILFFAVVAFIVVLMLVLIWFLLSRR